MLRKTVIDFGQTLQDWDGFGINYVETAQTCDYQADPQEYGGFGTLSETDRQAIVELIFGDDGRYTVEQGYYFYKQVCRAGQAGMAVTKVRANDTALALIGFARNGTKHPDAFVVINISEDNVEMNLEVPGTTSTSFEAFRTSDTERYVAVGESAEGTAGSARGIAYQAPPRSVTTFFGTD
jgi:hypothetical protein